VIAPDQLAKLATSTLEFGTEGLKTFNAAKEREAQTAARHESLDFYRQENEKNRAHDRELYLLTRQGDAAARRDEHVLRLDRKMFARFVENYPLHRPGTLHDNVRLVIPALEQVPVVLISPPSSMSDPTWRTLGDQVSWMLMDLKSSDDQFFIQVAERSFSWPNGDLFAHDLYDLSVIVLRADVVRGQLVVHLGGCNLGGPARHQALHQVAWQHLPPSKWFTPERVSFLESTSHSGFRDQEGTSEEARTVKLQMEWAERIAAVAAIIAVDAFHLLARTNYHELTDDALQLLGPEAGVPPRFEPVDMLADPAYHLLHVARRQLRAGAVGEATNTVGEALAVLALKPGGDPAADVQVARASGRLEPWHVEMLQEIRALPEGARVVALSEDDLARPADRAPAGRRAAPSTPTARRGRPVPITKRPPDPSEREGRGT
jgi:hypothetical protein